MLRIFLLTPINGDVAASAAHQSSTDSSAATAGRTSPRIWLAGHWLRDLDVEDPTEASGRVDGL